MPDGEKFAKRLVSKTAAVLAFICFAGCFAGCENNGTAQENAEKKHYVPLEITSRISGKNIVIGACRWQEDSAELCLGDELCTHLEFDGSGRRVRDVFYRSDRKEYSYKYRYDDNGNLIQVTKHYPDGTIAAKTVYGYGDNGKIAQEMDCGGDGWKKILYQYEYLYDDNGNIKQKTGYDSDGRVDVRIEYIYDENGNLTETIKYNAEQEVKERREYKYDSNGCLLKSTTYKDKLTYVETVYSQWTEATEAQYEFFKTMSASDFKMREMLHHGFSSDGKQGRS